MKLLALSSVLLLASAVIAAPKSGPAREASRVSRRAGRKSQPLQKIDSSTGTSAAEAADHVYETNWAGAVIETTGVQSVTGTFVVPVPTTNGSGAAWVGIDGNDCYTGILQSGINWTKSGSKVTYVAWYEWYPASMEYWTDFAVDGGDTIKVTVTATSTRSGTAVLENLTQDTSISHNFTTSETLSPICQTDAEWIVEDYLESFEFVTFADFGKVTFTDASAVTTAGTIGLGDADIYDIEQETGVPRTNSSIISDSSLAVSWIQ